MRNRTIAIKVDIIGTFNSYCSSRDELFKLYRVAPMQNAQALRESNLVAPCRTLYGMLLKYSGELCLMFPLIKLASIFPQRKFDLGSSFLTLNIKYSGNVVANAFNI